MVRIMKESIITNPGSTKGHQMGDEITHRGGIVGFYISAVSRDLPIKKRNDWEVSGRCALKYLRPDVANDDNSVNVTVEKSYATVSIFGPRRIEKNIVSNLFRARVYTRDNRGQQGAPEIDVEITYGPRMDPDNPRTSFANSPCQRAWSKVKLLDRLPDPPACRLAHTHSVVEVIRDCR